MGARVLGESAKRGAVLRANELRLATRDGFVSALGAEAQASRPTISQPTPATSSTTTTTFQDSPTSTRSTTPRARHDPLRLCRTCARPFPEQDLTRGRCAKCGPEYERDKSRRRRNNAGTKTRDSATWQKVRAIARARDGSCTQRHQGNCNGRLEVHHRIPIEHGGQPFDLANLVTLCRHHHEQAEAAFLVGVLQPPPGFREKSEGPSVGEACRKCGGSRPVVWSFRVGVEVGCSELVVSVVSCGEESAMAGGESRRRWLPTTRLGAPLLRC